MIFLELTLENVGLYRGRHTFDLRSKVHQPIILIGGLNGAGKTTLLDAIRLALYGHRAPCSTRGNYSYADFLRQCIHQRTEHASLELVFHHSQPYEPQPTEIRVTRSWTISVSQRDTLRVMINDDVAPDLSQAWDERIEDLLPLGISPLFLFDGEQVSALAEQDTLPPAVTQAIQVLLGLELPDRLAADLDVLTIRKRKDLVTAEGQGQLVEIERQLCAQTEEHRQLNQQIANLQSRLDRAQEALRQAEDRFLKEGGRVVLKM